PMNVFDAQVRGGYVVSKSGSLRVEVPEAYAKLVTDGQDVLAGFRPEDVRVGQGEHVGVVNMVERVGAYTVIHVDVGGLTLRLLQPSLSTSQRGDQVRFDVPPSAVALFDPKTGENLLRRG
ncbi:MAG: TOBE domain-containing protein, partial [Acidilobus sp.]